MAAATDNSLPRGIRGEEILTRKEAEIHQEPDSESTCNEHHGGESATRDSQYPQ